MVTEAIRHGLPCDVEALEETVKANVEAQQRDNESANEARRSEFYSHMFCMMVPVSDSI